LPSPLPATETPDPPASTAGRPGLEEIDSDIPFLLEEPSESIPTVRSGAEVVRDRTVPTESTGAPEIAAASPEDSTAPPTGAAKLARGLASFSRRNAEREKKFAHLLRDRAPAGTKPRPRGKRG
jgi:hypothetical protein